tara:strand:+ start:269 stop:448 length:180 start_codon:yes stop_codon:yes gene_type:complete
MSVINEIGGKFSIASELLSYLWHRKLWWMLPMVFVLILFGILIVVGTTSGVGPFIYTLF